MIKVWRTIRYGPSVDQGDDFLKTSQAGNFLASYLETIETLSTLVDYSIFEVDSTVKLAKVSAISLGFLIPPPVAKVYEGAFALGLKECLVADVLQLRMQWGDQPPGYVLAGLKPFRYGRHRQITLSLENHGRPWITVSKADPGCHYPLETEWIFRVE
jgi:hypothetical protein